MMIKENATPQEAIEALRRGHKVFAPTGDEVTMLYSQLYYCKNIKMIESPMPLTDNIERLDCRCVSGNPLPITSKLLEPKWRIVQKLKPHSWCTGQEWVDAGGSWTDFVEAHKRSTTAEFCLMRLEEYDDLEYNDPKDCYRLRLDENGELPGHAKSR